MDVVSAEPSVDQQRIIDRDPYAKLLVSADPGTGKTFTLIRRALSIAEGNEATVVALSFTRAVVGEMRDRAAATGGMPLRASTIDSYAANLVRRAGVEMAATFDDVIRQATTITVATPYLVPRPWHILVDEVQDLVGPRLAFVMALLRHCEGGFTLFGDPRQAIYAWEDDRSASDAFAAIRTNFPTLVEDSLETIQRPYVAERLKGESRAARGIDLVRDAAVMTSVRQAALAMRHGDCVLLTRTNGEALAMSQSLADDGYITLPKQGASARLPPPWLARFASADSCSRWTRKQVLKIGEEVDELPDPVEMWRTLRRIAGDGSDVSLQRLRLAVSQPWLHDDFQTTGGQLSTIHRAKGLEWDDVIVLEQSMIEVSQEEERVLFVAATRARRQLWRLKAPRFDGSLVLDRSDHRWGLLSWKKRYPIAIEAKIGDVSTSVPGRDTSIPASQALLRDCRSGEEVRLEPSDHGYEVLRAGTSIGRMTDNFSRAVVRRWGSDQPTLVGARILAVRAAAGDESLTESAGLGSSGIWLAPEIVGLVRPEKRDDN